MADPFLAEIRIFPFSFAPIGWALCNGQIMPISQSTALFSLLGTTYGGNGTSTFGLPNLQDRMPMHAGQGPGLTQRVRGEPLGTATVTLSTQEVPSHTHELRSSGTPGSSGTPDGSASFGSAGVAQVYAVASGAPVTLPLPLTSSGGGMPHNNRQPYLAFNFCIALQGVYPQRP